MRMTLVALLLAVSAVVAAESSAQGLPDLHPGERVRIAAPEQSPKRIVGTLTAMDSSSLTIATANDRVTVRREAIDKAEVSTRRSWKRKGARIGAGAGAALAVLAAATTSDKSSCFALGCSDPSCYSNSGSCSGGSLLTRGATAALGLLLFVPVGTGIGAMVAPGERWTPVPAPSFRASSSGRRHGLRFDVSIRF